MERIIFSPEQVKILQVNSNVVKCSSKAITYNKKFKLQAVKDYYEQGLGPNTIFERAGFDLKLLGKDKPKDCLKRWRKVFKTKGEKALATEGRGKNGGRKPKSKESADIEYLQTKIAYLEAENDFLRKLKTKPKA